MVISQINDLVNWSVLVHSLTFPGCLMYDCVDYSLSSKVLVLLVGVRHKTQTSTDLHITLKITMA